MTRYFNADTLPATLSAIGFEPSDVSYVRWAGARGPHDSIVAPMNVAVAFLLQLNTRGAAELRGAVATAFTRALANKAGILLVEAPTANASLTAAVAAAVDAPAPIAPTVVGQAQPAQPADDLSSNGSPPRHSLVHTTNNTVTHATPQHDTSYGLFTASRIASAESALVLYRDQPDDPRYQLALAICESSTSIARSIAGQEAARKVEREAVAGQEMGRKRSIEALAQITAAGHAADMLNSSGGGMNHAARRILRTTVLRCVDESIAPELADQVAPTLARIVGAASERKTALQHLQDKFQTNAPLGTTDLKKLRDAVFAAYNAFFPDEQSFISADKVLEKVGKSRAQVARYPVEQLDALAGVFQRFL